MSMLLMYQDIRHTQCKKLSVQNKLKHCIKPSSWLVSLTHVCCKNKSKSYNTVTMMPIC